MHRLIIVSSRIFKIIASMALGFALFAAPSVYSKDMKDFTLSQVPGNYRQCAKDDECIVVSFDVGSKQNQAIAFFAVAKSKKEKFTNWLVNEGYKTKLYPSTAAVPHCDGNQCVSLIGID